MYHLFYPELSVYLIFNFISAMQIDFNATGFANATDPGTASTDPPSAVPVFIPKTPRFQAQP